MSAYSNFGVGFVVVVLFVAFGTLAAYKVRHPEKSFVEIVKSWFR